MINSNQEVKLESRLRALKLLLYIPLDKSWDTQLPSKLKEENRQVCMIQEMNSKYNETKNTNASNRDTQNTSASNKDSVRAREKAIANTRDLFRDSSIKLYVPAFTAWRIYYPQRNYKVYTRLGVHNSNLQSFPQEVAQSQWSLQTLGNHKCHKLSLQLPKVLSKEMKLKKFVREITQLKWINLRAENLHKLILKWEYLKKENLKYFLLNKLDFSNIFQK